MLPKLNRIKNKKDFDLIFKKGKSLRAGPMVLKRMKNSSGCTRFAFIVSQKVSKKAVVRNKIRRRLAEISRAYLKEEKELKNNGTDFVFIGLPGAEKMDFLETKRFANKLLTNV